MDMEIRIGRGAEGTNTHHVPSSFKRVSRNHATFYWHNGVAFLEDNSSSNGTFVNGIRINKTQVLENDVVWLGGIGIDDQCYRLDLPSFFNICRNNDIGQRNNSPQNVFVANNPPAVNVNPPQVSAPRPAAVVNDLPPKVENERTDYTREFSHLKQAYIEYHEKMSKLTKKAAKRTQLPRVLLSMIPAVLGLITLIFCTDMTMRIVGMSAGSVLSGLIGALTMGSGSSKKEKLEEEILDLQLKYKKEYKCPKCGKEYDLDLHWKKLRADGKCPYGCGARFD